MYMETYEMTYIRLQSQVIAEGCELRVLNVAIPAFAFLKETNEPVIAMPNASHEYSIEEKVIAIAHELGHYHQFKTIGKGDMEHWRRVREQTPESWVEEDAWERAVTILNNVGFTGWDRFYREVEACIATYYISEEGFPQGMDKAFAFRMQIMRQVRDLKEVMSV